MFSTVAVSYIMLYIIIMQQRAHGQTKQEKVTVCVSVSTLLLLFFALPTAQTLTSSISKFQQVFK